MEFAHLIGLNNGLDYCLCNKWMDKKKKHSLVVIVVDVAFAATAIAVFDGTIKTNIKSMELNIESHFKSDAKLDTTKTHHISYRLPMNNYLP